MIALRLVAIGQHQNGNKEGLDVKKIIAAAMIAMTVVLSGCGSKEPVRQVESFTHPAIGTVTTRGIGEPLIRQDTGVLDPEVEIVTDISVGGYRLPKGRYYYDGEDAVGKYFGGRNQDLNISRDQYFYIRKSDDYICIYKTSECARANYILGKKLSSLSADSFQQTLFYNGKIGNRITLGYREFASNQARAAFSNTVDYDMAESAILGYKGVRLEVIKATNMEISYKILSGFAN